MEERRRRKEVKLMDKEFCVMSCCSRNIHGGKTWEEVKHIAHGARNTTISLAKQVGLPQLVVVKYAAIDDSDTLQRQSEVHAKFQGCPYILRCYGDEYCTAKDNGRIIYNVLFEHASGGNLADLIKTSRGGARGLPESDVKSFTKSILLGLDCIHNKGYAHLDIKPKNILLVPDLSKKRKRGASASAAFDAKIADFWIAKSSKQILAELRWEDRWCLEGTPRYMSPEAIAEHKKGPACDIWALGCVVVEMLCGQPAFSIKPGESLEDFLDRIGFGGESPRIPVGISREAQDFLKRCFVRNSKSRWNASRLLSHPFLKDHIPDAESPHKKLCFAITVVEMYVETLAPRENAQCIGKASKESLRGKNKLLLTANFIKDHYSDDDGVAGIRRQGLRKADSGASADDFVAKIAHFATAKSFNQISTDFVYAIE
ncbi:hypothetical protein Syun_008640 [Stephania yunnanensis]|uniref:Protein kinase domain-containing protein n=1 Tax=Stephania yunnanensis TaxID=152371 RepID=A0AAP0KCY8_9MAGN